MKKATTLLGLSIILISFLLVCMNIIAMHRIHELKSTVESIKQDQVLQNKQYNTELAAVDKKVSDAQSTANKAVTDNTNQDKQIKELGK